MYAGDCITHPTKETIAIVARSIAALHQEADANTQLATALQQLHDTCLVMTSCATVDTHTYTHAKLVRAEVVTLVVAANHGANTANDQLRRATLEFATAMANIGPDTPHPNTLTSHNTPKRTPSRRWRAGFRASQSSESPAPAHTHATRDWSLRRGHVPAPASPGRLPATRGCRVPGGG